MQNMRKTRVTMVLVLALAAVLASADAARAQAIAVIGDNAIDNFIAGLPGKTATLVTDSQLATPGFLNSFAALVMTRNGFSFGSGLSSAAAANVAAYVGSTGRVVLLNADFADDVGTVFTNTLITNAVNFAAASGRGFVGEFNGAVSGLTSNSNGFNPIGLVSGSAGPLGFGQGGSSGSINLTAAGTGHPVTAGLSLPFNPPAVEFGAAVTGVDASLILATFDGGNPAIIASAGVAGCPPHRIHGHISTVPSVHPGNFHEHHGQHGHIVAPNCPPHSPNPHPPSPPPAETGPGGSTTQPSLSAGATGLEADGSNTVFAGVEPTDFVGALNQDGILNGDSGSLGTAGTAVAPSRRRSVVQLFGSAQVLFLGDEDRPATDFTPPASGSPLYYTTSLPEVRIGGILAKVIFSGLAPGLTGVWQINVLVPENAPAGKLPVTISYEGDQLTSVDLFVAP